MYTYIYKAVVAAVETVNEWMDEHMGTMCVCSCLRLVGERLVASVEQLSGGRASRHQIAATSLDDDRVVLLAAAHHNLAALANDDLR